MAYPQGLFKYPGVGGVLSAAYALQHGISPGIISLEITPQNSDPAPFGTVGIWWGGNQIIELADCRVDSASMKYDSNGQLVSLQIQDRRWRWAFGSIFGTYNLRKDDGRLWAAREMAPKDLLSKCFDAAGEQNYDVSRCPNSHRPTVEWVGDIPMQAAARICDAIGARIVLHVDGHLSVEEPGIGESMPQGALLEEADVLQIPSWPDQVGMICGPSRNQGDFTLEAVGMETKANNSVWKKLDDLSYKPPKGWENAGLKFMSISDKEQRDLAKRYVNRVFRIVDKNPLVTIPGYNGTVESLDQILPIEDTLVETTATEDVTDPSVAQNKPAVVWGNFYDGGPAKKNTMSDPTSTPPDEPDAATTYVRDFRIDRHKGYLYFHEPMRILDSKNNNFPTAKLKLRVAFSVRDKDTWAWVRHTQTQDISDGSGLGMTQWLRRDDIVFSQYKTGEGQKDNSDLVEEECNYYLESLLKQFQIGRPQVGTFHGLRADIDVDGAIQSISWTTGGGSRSSTKVCLNIEFDKLAPTPYRERRLREMNAQSSKEAVKSSQTKRRDGKRAPKI